MKLKLKQSKRFERGVNQILDISVMLEQKGEYSPECRYLEIMAILLLSIDESLNAFRSFFYFGFGFLLGHLLVSFISSL